AAAHLDRVRRRPGGQGSAVALDVLAGGARRSRDARDRRIREALDSLVASTAIPDPRVGRRRLPLVTGAAPALRAVFGDSHLGGGKRNGRSPRTNAQSTSSHDA